MAILIAPNELPKPVAPVPTPSKVQPALESAPAPVPMSKQAAFAPPVSPSALQSATAPHTKIVVPAPMAPTKTQSIHHIDAHMTSQAGPSSLPKLKPQPRVVDGTGPLGVIFPGGTLEDIQAVFPGRPNPEVFNRDEHRPPNSVSLHGFAPTQSLRLADLGVWFFLTPENVIYNIRLDPPFSGTVAGIHLGDSREQVITILGPPTQLPTAFGGQSAPNFVIYRGKAGLSGNIGLTAEHLLRVNYSMDGHVASLMLLKPAS
ncbi:MAG: hypothetical protein P4L87_01950 [Formivibrio sp.]|nr:hypothetical protein [Formivibrio sp.]